MATKANTIRETMDYSKFKYFDWHEHRISKPHVARLAASMKEHNLLNLIPIVVTEDHYVIDGQNRLEAAKKAEVKVSYIVSPVTMDNIKIIGTINTFVKRWTLTDAMNMYTYLDIKDYSNIQRLSDKYELAPNTVVALARMVNDEKRDSFHRLFLIGDYKCKDIEALERVTANVAWISSQLREGVSDSKWVPRALILLMQFPGFDMEIMKDQVEKYAALVEREYSIRGYLSQLAKVYNHYRPSHRLLLTEGS